MIREHRCYVGLTILWRKKDSRKVKRRLALAGGVAATLTKTVRGVGDTVIGTNLPVQPVNVGPTPIHHKSTAWPFDSLHKLAPLSNTEGVNSFSGFNVHSIAFQIPITMLTTDGQPAKADGSNSIMGVWATRWRRQTRVLSQPRLLPVASALVIVVARGVIAAQALPQVL
jgi:Domain of unknown function (DUF4331)